MFRRAATLILVEAFREVYADPDFWGTKPNRIDMEYPEASESWPAILVQFRPDKVSLTGINSDEIVAIEDAPDKDGYVARHIREGNFSGNVDLTCLALNSQERDRMWDELTELLLMGDLTDPTAALKGKIDEADLIAMTAMTAEVQPVGDSISPGVPWDGEILAYEATLRFAVLGQFYADQYTRRLLPLTDIQVFPYTDIEEPPYENDGEGAWL